MTPERAAALLAKVLRTDGSVTEEEARSAAVIYVRHEGQVAKELEAELARKIEKINFLRKSLDTASSVINQANEEAQRWRELTQTWEATCTQLNQTIEQLKAEKSSGFAQLFSKTVQSSSISGWCAICHMWKPCRCGVRMRY